ncbi:MAG: sec-independent protein translocase protein TatA [Acidobacteriota bacterium]|nr:sec-independent protein translocase protein TatA [Acidobacteriota bacterium]
MMMNESIIALGLGGLGGPELIVILLIVFLLFGASRLPQLAKALGQSKRAFRDGIDEAEAEAQRDRLKQSSTAPAELTGVDDEALFEEARRRAAARRASEKS